MDLPLWFWLWLCFSSYLCKAYRLLGKTHKLYISTLNKTVKRTFSFLRYSIVQAQNTNADVLCINLTHQAMNLSQNVLKVSNACHNTSRLRRRQRSPLTDGCNDNQMSRLSHSINSLCYRCARLLTRVQYTQSCSTPHPVIHRIQVRRIRRSQGGW